MASAEGLERSSPHKARLYDFCIKFLKISGIRLPAVSTSGTSIGNSAKNTRRYFLKITLLQGSEQQEIGEFEVIGGECVVNHQLSCQIAYGRPDKLHVYIDQDWSAGLSGHITVDLKEFFEDVDAEIYLEYPLFSSGPTNGVTVRRAAKLSISVLCTCFDTTTAISNQYDPNIEYMGFEDISKLRPTSDDRWYPPVQLDTVSSHDAQSMLDSNIKQVSPENMRLVQAHREVEMLKDMEGEHRRNLPSRPEALAAMFFSAGMAFQRQVDCVNRRRMYWGTEDPLLPGENRHLLLEDVSPNYSSGASANTESQKVGTLYQRSSRSLVFSEGSSHSCGFTESCSCSSEATTSLAGDMDQDENYFHSPLRAEDMPMSHPDPELVSLSTSKSSCSPLEKPSSSMSLVEIESISRKRGSVGKYSVDSVVLPFASAGLPGASKETHSKLGGDDGQVIVSGSMLGRQQVTSIQTIRKSNPGLGWLSHSMQP